MNNSTGGERWVPGQIMTADGELSGLPDRKTASIRVTNTGDRPIQVGSHFHFFETNRALEFDRKAAYGMRLLIPAGTAVRFEPGQTQDVNLVALGGQRVVYGLNGLVQGALDDEGTRSAALEAARRKGFRGSQA